MKKVRTIALFSAVCISAAAFTGCVDIPEALMYASAPHISEDSEIVTESMKIKEKFLNKEDVTFKPDKSVKSRINKIDNIVNSGNYTLSTYSFYSYSEESHVKSDAFVTNVDFEKKIVSNEDSWNVTGSYYIDKDQKPINDKKTCYGAYYENIIKDGREYYRDNMHSIFYQSDESYYDIQQNSHHESVATGKATIDGIDYDAEIVSYLGFFEDDKYYSSESEESEVYDIWIYDDEYNTIITYNIDQSEAEESSIIMYDIENAAFLIYKANADNSSVIQKPKKYISDNIYGMFTSFVN